MPESAADFVLESELIVIGMVQGVSASEVRFAPEAFLKGPSSGEPIVFHAEAEPLCPTHAFAAGERALVYVYDASELPWPLLNQVFVLQGGRATMGELSMTELQAVEEIRGITGQYAVPAVADGGEGAGIDWDSTVLPIGVVLLIVFGIGLLMMRVWHRIDPS